jgi:YD repeat-containing protein
MNSETLRNTVASLLCLVVLTFASGACVRAPNALDPATDPEALLAWLFGYQGFVFAAPGCGFATPTYRVANAAETSILLNLPHSRNNTTFNFTLYQLFGCTPRTLANSGSGVTFELAYHANGVIQSRRDQSVGTALSAAISAEGRVVSTRNEDSCTGGDAIERFFYYDTLNRLLRAYSPAAPGCSGWSGEETNLQYEGFSRFPVRSQYYDPPGVLFADAITSYSRANDRIVRAEDTCVGGSSCTGQAIQYTYNESGQLTQEEEVLSGAFLATYTYDAFGRIATATSAGNVVTYTYDDAGRMILVTESSPALTLTLAY